MMTADDSTMSLAAAHSCRVRSSRFGAPDGVSVRSDDGRRSSGRGNPNLAPAVAIPPTKQPCHRVLHRHTFYLVEAGRGEGTAT
jgi:hypothetical protein